MGLISSESPLPPPLWARRGEANFGPCSLALQELLNPSLSTKSGAADSETLKRDGLVICLKVGLLLRSLALACMVGGELVAKLLAPSAQTFSIY